MGLNKEVISLSLHPSRETQKQEWEYRYPWATHHLSGKALMKVLARNLRSLLQALSSMGMSTVLLPHPLLLCLIQPQHPLHLLFRITLCLCWR